MHTRVKGRNCFTFLPQRNFSFSFFFLSVLSLSPLVKGARKEARERRKKRFTVPSYLWQYELGCVFTRLDAISPQSSNFLPKFRTVPRLADVYQQIAELRHLAVDLLNLLRNEKPRRAISPGTRCSQSSTNLRLPGHP